MGIKSLLHAEQSFEYERPIFAGDRIYVATRVADVLERNGPAGKHGRGGHRGRGARRGRCARLPARRTLVVRASQGEFERTPWPRESSTSKRCAWVTSSPPLTKAPVDRVQLARYAGASGDFNPVHVDETYARALGMPSVYAPGMLVMGFLGQLISDWSRGAQLRRYAVRFSKIVWPGDTVVCKGRVTERWGDNGRYFAEVDLWAENQKGELVLRGAALMQLFYSHGRREPSALRAAPPRRPRAAKESHPTAPPPRLPDAEAVAAPSARGKKAAPPSRKSPPRSPPRK